MIHSSGKDTYGQALQGSEQILEDIRAWLLEQQSFPRVQRSQGKLLAELEIIERRRERLLAPLNIVLAGGTGVGKSSLLNALAGATISETSDRRAFTSDYTCYHHSEDQLAVAGELLSSGQTVSHEREALRDKIIVDTPDFDSAEAAHRDKLRAALKVADLVIWVTTAQKYANLSGLETLLEFQRGREFVFVLNRDDESLSDALLADFEAMLCQSGFHKPRLFRISALAWLARKQGTATGELLQAGRDNGRLDEFISRELDKKRIRMLKEGNLSELIVRVLDHIDERLPQALPEQLKGWLKAGEQAFEELDLKLRQRLQRQLLSRRAFQRRLQYRLASLYQGLFGAWMQTVFALRALADLDYPDLFQARKGPELGLNNQAESGLEGDLGELIEAKRCLQSLGRQLGLSASVTHFEDSKDRLENSLKRFYQAIDWRIHQVLEDTEEQILKTWSHSSQQLALNAIPGLWLVFVIVFWFELEFFHAFTSASQHAAPGHFTAGLLITAMILWLCQRFAEWRHRSVIDQLLTRLDALVGDALSATVRVDLTRSQQQRVEAVLEEWRQFQDLRQRAQNLLVEKS